MTGDKDAAQEPEAAPEAEPEKKEPKKAPRFALPEFPAIVPSMMPPNIPDAVRLQLQRAAQLEIDRLNKSLHALDQKPTTGETGEPREGEPSDEATAPVDENPQGEAEEPEQSSESALLAIKLRAENLKLKHMRQRLKMRQDIAAFATRIVVLQLFMTNVVVGAYVMFNIKTVEPSVIIAWLGGTAVEVIGILLVITQNLFPNNGKNAKQDEIV